MEAVGCLTSPFHMEWSRDDIIDRVAVVGFLLASYLTDPICKVHELFVRLHVVDAEYHLASKVVHLAMQFLFFLGMVGCGMAALFTTLPGVLLRVMAAQMQKEPFIYSKGEAPEKSLQSYRSFTILSWNVCCLGGGYPILVGGVFPWHFRIDHIIKKIEEVEADVVCLYETFDTWAAFDLSEKLKQLGYVHIYFNVGPRVVGVSSGILVASKYGVENPEFTPFPQDTLVGKTKGVAKGVFAVDLQSDGWCFARIFSTHLQQSEEPAYPIAEEVEARRREMELIMEKVERVRGRCLVVTGDLNLDDDEYCASSWSGRFQKEDAFEDATWGGDAFCARLQGKRVSGPLNLDHTMVVRGTVRSIRTTLARSGYDHTRYRPEALSDHNGILSRITV